MLKETKVTLSFCTAPSFSQTTLQVFQLPHYLLLLHLSVPPQLGDNLQWVLVPSTKSVHNQKNENDSLCLASFTVFPHFDIEGMMLDSVFFLTGDLSSKLLMKGSILAQRESRTSAGRSSLPGRSPAGSFRGPRASWDTAARRLKWSIRNKNNEHETHLKKPQLDLLHLMKQKLSLALILVLKAVLYVGSKSWWSQRLFWKITSNDALMFTYSNTSLSLNSLLSDKVFTSHLWSAWPWRCNDIFDLL